VGTSGLAGVARQAGYVPQLLILDEQHKFSTAEREALVGPHTHVVEVSATPVPRSLATSLYEGMQILNLRECPVDKTIDSEVLDMGRRGEVVARIREALSRGERAAVIYPQVNVVDESGPDEEAKANSVEAAFASLSKVFPGQAVMLHGEMDDAVMRSNIAMLRNGARRLVVASTVLEIGIDIPSVSVMVVRDADRFGISQLHQLRGRLARNGGHGRFMMVVESESDTPPDALDRLYAVAETTDGYELAERDLLMRGFGDVDGAAQTGASRTLFRMLKIGPGDFMRRRLRTEGAQLMAELGSADSTRTFASGRQGTVQPVQERLL
jgi:ATP-dependent DNA helicase RecG